MEIRPLDASDPEAMAAWHAAYHEAHVFGLDHPSPWLLEEMRAEFLGTRPGERTEPFAGYVDGRLAVAGVLELPLMDNLTLARVDVATPPARRRRGLGSAMLAHLSARARGLGRHRLITMASWAYDAPADGSGTTNADFLTAHGFTFSLGEVKRVLTLPADDDHLARLHEHAAPYHRGYTIRSWAGAVPDDVIDAFGTLIGSLITEAPMGEQEFEPEVFDATRIRADERVMAEAGRTKYTTVATAPDGEMVGYSEIGVPSYEHDNAYQWGTLVRPGHRGHRLGLATKVHNLQRFQAAEAGRSVLFTWNAEVNRHMIAVNEAMGFRPVGRSGEFSKQL